MGSKKYDDDDIHRLGEAMAEYIVDKMKAAVEAIDEIKVQVSKIPWIDERLTVMEEKIDTIEYAIADTNKDVKSLDKGMGNVEHRVDYNGKQLMVMTSQLKDIEKDIKTLGRNATIRHEEHLRLATRVDRLEARA